jgi:hypothetical protein
MRHCRRVALRRTKADVEHMFMECDFDKSGTISRPELKMCLRQRVQREVRACRVVLRARLIVPAERCIFSQRTACPVCRLCPRRSDILRDRAFAVS